MFHERLKTRRKELGITQGALAKKLRVSQQSVAKWESGASSPNPSTVAEIAEILNVSTDYLVGRAAYPGTGKEDTDEILQQLKDRPEMQLLFSKTRKATKDDILRAANYLDTLAETQDE